MDEILQVVRACQHYGWIAFIATVFLTPIAMRLAHQFGVLDIPDKNLKPHAKPTPYLGGIAICGGWTLALLASMLGGLCPWRMMLPLLMGGVAMSVLGLVDDVRHIAPKTRLAIGTVIVTLAIACSGAGFDFVDFLVHSFNNVFGTGISLPPFIAVPVSVVLGAFIVLGACNSTNLIDGLDGLATGVTGIISAGFFVLAAHLAAWGRGEGLDDVRLVLAIAVFGASLGFLPWNFNPARIFMGDAGSVLLGYNCGMLILLFADRGSLRWVIGALMMFALPIFDTALAMVRRWRAGRSIFEGDRSHFYDQLVQRGLSVRQTVVICYALTLIYAGFGLLLSWVHEGEFIRTRYTVIFYLVICLLTALGAWAAGLTRPEEPRGQPPAPRPGD